MRILITGRSGQVGSALVRSLAVLGEVEAHGRETLDLLHLEDSIARARPDVIVNAAAYTAVDRAEQDRDAAFRVNADAVGRLACEAKSVGALLVHFSTDYVFDGEKASPYVEADAVNPLNVYGASKLAGEQAIVSSGCRHLIFRTSWVFSSSGRNFMAAILAAAKSQPELRVVNDQHGAPTSNLAIADAVRRILARKDLAQHEGIFHLSAGGATTWHGFAKAILEAKGLTTPLLEMSSSAYPAVARRPRNSRLDNARLAAEFGVALPGWREGLAAVLRSVN